MTACPVVVLALLGIGIGTVLAVGRGLDSSRPELADAATLRARAIEAQRLSAEAARLARELAERAARAGR